MNHTNFKKNELVEWVIKEIQEKCKMTISTDFIKNKLIDLISNSEYKELLKKNFKEDVTLDEIQYQELYREIMSIFGYVREDEFSLSRKILADNYNDIEAYTIINKEFLDWINCERSKNEETLHPDEFLEIVIDKYGFSMLNIAVEIINYFIDRLYSSPYYHKSKWGDIKPINLDDLYNNEKYNSDLGCFFDQRYIDYLNKNIEELKDINWRKFEQLSAQFFHNEGYDVELGKGRNDGGVDIILTKDNKKILVQCKRDTGKVNKDVIKDVDWTATHNDFNSAIIICTSDITKGGYGLIDKYGLKMKIINGEIIAEKLNIYSTKI